ncbi:potassium channel family protein [Lamprocystis purpurea]|uniref:potassium channel family protein n=1 Tax=Lamprocystis purpurea TaxID=61598 RepID=UPI000364CD53|nr:NAD-binding protein [Lamprocystis purpurea]
MVFQLRRSTKRLLALVATLPAALLLLAVIYMLGMSHLEGDPRGFWDSLEWASETLTTTGYGRDAHWHHPAMTLFVVTVQLSGMFLIFLLFPTYVLPYFEERFEQRLPRRLPSMGGRVLFHRYGPSVDSLVAELRRVGAPFVILEQDRAIGRALVDRGFRVVVGQLDEDPELLAGVERARALVTSADDHLGATFVMIARERGFAGPIYALAANPLHRAPLIKVGATLVYTPSHVLAAALAAHASTRISPQAEGLQSLGGQAGIAEYRVHPESPLAGQALGAIHLRERLGINLIGQWQGGRFTPARGPATRIAAGAILVAIGRPENLVRLEALAAPIRRAGAIVVAGLGEVGRKVVEMLHDAGETTIVIDEHDHPGVDVVGNVLDPHTLEQARVREAGTLVLALSDDSSGVFGTAVIRDYAPHVRLIARVNRASNVPRLHQAGADFALAVGQVAGQLLAHHLLGESGLSVEQRLRCMRVRPGTLVGKHPWHAGVRERSGASVVAMERGGEVFVDLPADLRVTPEDALFICGTTEGLSLFQREFRSAPWVVGAGT